MRRLSFALAGITLFQPGCFVNPRRPRRLAQVNRALLLNPDAPEFQAPAPAVSHLALETSRGTVSIEVMRDWGHKAPTASTTSPGTDITTSNRFFRVNPGRWMQFGINGDPAIAKAWRTKTLPDDPFKTSNTRGTVAFAFAVPNGRTTQIFFNMGDNSPTHDPPRKTCSFPSAGSHRDGRRRSFNAEYREGPGGIRAGKQDPFFEGGNAWLLREFPKLDYIKKVLLVVH